MAETRIKKVKVDKNPETGVATYTFTSGQTVTVDVNKFDDAIRSRLLLHGAVQKLSDCFAGDAAEDAYASFDETLANLLEGKWSEKRATGEASPTLTLEAVAAVLTAKGKDPAKAADIIAVLKTRDANGDAAHGLNAFRKSVEYITAVSQIKLARAQKSATSADSFLPAE